MEHDCNLNFSYIIMAAKQIQHKAGLVAAYIQRHAKTPLLVSMQGPQGSG